MTKLKPCPFCGSDILEMDKAQNPYSNFDDHFWFVTCYQCPCQGVEAKTKEEAIKAWNTRA